MNLTITIGDPRTRDVRELLEAHLGFAHAVTPPGHVHALGLEGLLDPSVTFFVARSGHALAGVGALRELPFHHAEIKSMHTAADWRRRGVGQAILDHILGVAAARGHVRVSLETGTMPAFEPARRLYERAGFETCEPFGDYTTNPHSVCMTMSVAPACQEGADSE